jgi:hypothetical protein
MRESCLYGSVRGDRGNPVPYRDNAIQWERGGARYGVRDLARSAATPLLRDDRCRWRMDERLGADVLRYQVGVLSQPVAGTFDLNHHSMVEQAIEQRGGGHGTAENLAPFGEAAI